MDSDVPLVAFLGLPDHHHQAPGRAQRPPDVGEGDDGVIEEHRAEPADCQVEALLRKAVDLCVGVLEDDVAEPLGLGLLAGTIARAIIPVRTEPGGCIGTTAVGILGALIGGFIATALDIGEIDDFFDLGTWLIAIGGSVLLLLIIRAVAR